MFIYYISKNGFKISHFELKLSNKSFVSTEKLIN